jgi:hypothetical protein
MLISADRVAFAGWGIWVSTEGGESLGEENAGSPKAYEWEYMEHGALRVPIII